jgi:serine/threonine protein kinase
MIGRRILNYKIESVIGKGGMGEVYLATHETIGRKVAIKSLLQNLIGHPEIRQRFINEAKVMSQLSHSNIVGLLDYHEEPDGLYLIMDYVDGTPLDELIKNVTGPIGGETCVNYVKQILEAFHYAHSRGMVHRDIKPSNVMITRDGQVKVLDFGIAKILDSGTSSLTKTGAQMGTVFYMSPEQVEGKEADVRSDIYSLGVTIYQIATGSNPYQGLTTEYEIYSKIVKEQLPDPKSVYPGVSDAIAALILKATAKDPADRFQSCKEMLDVLRSGEVVNVPKPKNKKVSSGSVSSSKPKSKVKFVIIGALLFGMIASGIYAYTAGLFNFGKEQEKITMFPVVVNEKVSYFDSQGKEVIAAQFTEGSLFYDGLALVNTGADDEEPKYGYIDQTGKYVINPQYEEATIFNDGIAWVVKTAGKITAINTTGKELFTVDASIASSYSEGLAAFAPYLPEKGSNGLKHGYLDEDGKIKIEPKFDIAASFHSNRARIGILEKNSEGEEFYKYAFIDKSGTVVGEYYESATDFQGEYAVVIKEGKCGAINTSGKLVVPIMYDALSVDGEWFLYTSADGKYGWLDGDGKIIINAQFDGCQPFYDSELAPVQIAEKWGYIARDGKIMINPQFDAACSFKGEITAVEQSEKIGFIDKEGKYVIAPNLNWVSPDLLNAIDAQSAVGYSGENYRFARTHFFDAAAIAGGWELEKPGGYDPQSTSFGMIRDEWGMDNNEFSNTYDCYDSRKSVGGGGSSFYVNLMLCGYPWQTKSYTSTDYLFGFWAYERTGYKSVFDENASVTFKYNFYIVDNVEENSEKLITEFRNRLLKEGYTESMNMYSKNGVNVTFGKMDEGEEGNFYIYISKS